MGPKFSFEDTSQPAEGCQIKVRMVIGVGQFRTSRADRDRIKEDVRAMAHNASAFLASKGLIWASQAPADHRVALIVPFDEVSCADAFVDTVNRTRVFTVHTQGGAHLECKMRAEYGTRPSKEQRFT